GDFKARRDWHEKISAEVESNDKCPSPTVRKFSFTKSNPIVEVMPTVQSVRAPQSAAKPSYVKSQVSHSKSKVAAQSEVTTSHSKLQQLHSNVKDCEPISQTEQQSSK